MKGYSPLPEGVIIGPGAVAASGVTGTISPNQQGYRPLARTVRSRAPGLHRICSAPSACLVWTGGSVVPIGGGECPRTNPSRSDQLLGDA